MSTATSDLSDLQLSEEERAAETAAEGEHEARMRARRAELADLDDEALEALSAGDDTPTIDVNLADGLLEERAAARREQEELDGEDADADAGEDEQDEGQAAAGEDKVGELQGEAGEAVGEMPAPKPDDTVVPPDQILLRHDASAPKWAGKQPGTTFVKLKGVKFEVDGGFRAGESFRFSGVALVTSEGKKDVLDKDTRSPREAVQEHEAVVMDFELVEE